MSESTPDAGVRLQLEARIARITLSRPDQHNALRAQDVDALLSAFDRIDDDPAVRVVLLSGEGRTFCAGASLTEMESGAMTPEKFDGLTTRLAALRPPTICAVNGSAYGGGVEVALCCDLRIGVHGSRFAVPAAELGVCYPVRGIRRYVERLGFAYASRLLLTGEVVDAEEMQRMGFFTRCVDSEELAEAADELASRVAGLAPLAVQAMADLLRRSASSTLDAADAARWIATCAQSQDLQEGFRARREGRAPFFEGR